MASHPEQQIFDLLESRGGRIPFRELMEELGVREVDEPGLKNRLGKLMLDGRIEMSSGPGEVHVNKAYTKEMAVEWAQWAYAKTFGVSFRGQHVLVPGRTHSSAYLVCKIVHEVGPQELRTQPFQSERDELFDNTMLELYRGLSKGWRVGPEPKDLGEVFHAERIVGQTTLRVSELGTTLGGIRTWFWSVTHKSGPSMRGSSMTSSQPHPTSVADAVALCEEAARVREWI